MEEVILGSKCLLELNGKNKKVKNKIQKKNKKLKKMKKKMQKKKNREIKVN